VEEEAEVHTMRYWLIVQGKISRWATASYRPDEDPELWLVTRGYGGRKHRRDPFVEAFTYEEVTLVMHWFQYQDYAVQLFEQPEEAEMPPCNDRGPWGSHRLASGVPFYYFSHGWHDFLRETVIDPSKEIV